MSFDERIKTEKPNPAKYLKRGDGTKTRKFYGHYAMYPENEEPLYGVDPNLKDVDPEYGELYPNNIEGSIKYLDPRSSTKSTRGGRRRRMKQTKRKRRKQTKRRH